MDSLFCSSSSPPELHLSDTLIQNNITYNYQIFNYGPSNIKELSVTLQIPVVFVLNLYNHVKIVKFDGADLNIFYKNKQFEVKWTKIEMISNFSNKNSLKNNDGKDFDRSELGYDYDLNHQNPEPDLSHMRKRSLDCIDSSKLVNESKLNLNDSVNTTEYEKSQTDRIIVFDCMQPDNKNVCIEAEFILEDFQTENEPVTISFNFSFILHEFGKFF